MTFSQKEGDETQVDAATTPAPEQTPAATQPAYITANELGDFEKRLDQKLEKLYQGVQSRQDKFQAKVQKTVDTWVDASRKAGVEPTDAQKQLIANNAYMQALNQEVSSVSQPGNAAGQPQPQNETADQLVARVNDAADAMLEVNGVEINESDPDYLALVKPVEKGTPQQYLTSVQQYIAAKLAKQSTSNTQAQPQPQTATSVSPGLVKGAPKSNPIQDVMNGDELWRLATKSS